jgi:hypothetical protein
MEKQPIDEFFSEKLKNTEIKPSERAKALFLQKLEAQKKPLFIGFEPRVLRYIGVAAAIVIVASVGLFYKNQSNNNQQIAKVITSIPKPKITTENTDREKPIINNLRNEENQIQPKSNTKVSFTSSLVANYKVSADNKSAIINPLDLLKIDDSDPEILFTRQLENQKIEEIAHSNKLKETVISISPLDIQDYSLYLSHQEETNLRNKVNQENLSDEEEKTLFAKVLNEMKGLKKGEKVDFNKLGFKSLEDMAINKDGFIASESRQIKEKFNWIKSKLSNN